MNATELSLLNQSISNDAKLLYCIGIRPLANANTGRTSPLNYRNLITKLNGQKNTYTLGRQINQLIDELLAIGLVDFFDGKAEKTESYNNRVLCLPSMVNTNATMATLHNTRQVMTIDWLPDDDLVSTLAKMMGLINSQYDDDLIGEFRAYWLGRPDNQFTLYQWTQKFVFQLKNKRTMKVNNQQIVGTQQVSKAPGISVNNNAKALVEKYHGKNHKAD